ncbi:MAG TPA: aldehyde dehydrogenase family protein [Puia sp.]|nr:aldehyde dehydrogenase family protein [Puia sp.]
MIFIQYCCIFFGSENFLCYNGQACIGGTRLLVPVNRLEDVKKIVRDTISGLKVGNPENEETVIGSLANQKQYDRVQGYIKSAEEEGAELLIGGEGHPDGLNEGFFAKRPPLPELPRTCVSPGKKYLALCFPL